MKSQEWFETRGRELERKFIGMLLWADKAAKERGERLKETQITELLRIAISFEVE